MIDEPLGQGGMGSVYLATHIGTQRPVAVKVIAPQFMAHTEFVERFRREAEAAGRLRHPNVVNVTDFGFTRVDSQQLAYLVMEYLDGCSLAEVLAEEGKLPLPWVTDILEQVCSAIEEAHQCGIIHRDLKPDNIWLEPNRRGGYTIKVLDFGLAKIAEAEDPLFVPTTASASNSLREPLHLTDEFTEADTRVQTPTTDSSGISEEETNIMPAVRSRSHSGASASLTRIGTILGTPLYMSPEQCLGQPLGVRSDIYSLGVIAYQMLGGCTPFTGDGNSLIKKHVEEPPPPLKLLNKKIPKQVSDLVMSALAKNPADRPASAASFASAFRARSEGVIALLRQGVSFYSEHFPTFFKIALISHIPVIVMAVLFGILGVAFGALHKSTPIVSKVLEGLIGLCSTLFGPLIAKVVSQYVFVPATAQLLLAPLREVSIRKIFDQLKEDLVPLIKTSIRVHVYSFIYGIPLIFTGFIAYMNYLFYIPVFIMEGRRGTEAMQRSKELVRRIRRVVIPLFIISLFLNSSISDSISRLVVTIPSVLMSPLISIVFTLAYIRARQTEGETMNEILARVAQEEEIPTSRWQQKIREKTRIARLTTRQSANQRINCEKI